MNPILSFGVLNLPPSLPKRGGDGEKRTCSKSFVREVVVGMIISKNWPSVTHVPMFCQQTECRR
jgi:hypothetical protein